MEYGNELTMGSLFDGIGGFPLAAMRNNIRPVWASEIEPFPIQVTKHHFPDMIHVGDITKLDGALLPPVDIVCGGSPCQDYAEEIVIPRNSLKCLSSRHLRQIPRNNKLRILVNPVYPKTLHLKRS